MNKYELKYCFEEEARKNSELIDVVGKNAYHIQDLYAEIKKKDKLKNIIQSQTQKNLREYHFGEDSVDN